MICFFFFFSSRRRHTRCGRDWSSDVCSSDLLHRRGLGHDGRRARRLRGPAPGPGQAGPAARGCDRRAAGPRIASDRTSGGFDDVKKGRVVVALVAIVGALVWVAAKGLSSSLVYYKTPTELLQQGHSA